MLAALRGPDQDRAPVAARGAGDRARSRLGRPSTASSFARTRPATSSCVCPPARVARRRRLSSCKGIWTWSASVGPDSPYDPAEGRIALVRDGDWLTADGTTLGADNGIGIAAMMALAEDESLPHGPLELLMTVNEEIGGPGEGASGLDPSPCQRGDAVEPRQRGRREADRRLGEQHRHVDPGREAAEPRATPGAATLAVSASGGLGGHSGIDIAHGRANAIKVLGAYSARRSPSRPSGSVSLQGGKSWNAIPRDATAICSLAARARGRLPCRCRGFSRGDRATPTRSTDPGVTVTVTRRGRRGGRLDGRRRP